MKQFEVGKTYVTHHNMDASVTQTMTVVARTEKTLSIKMPHLGKARRRVYYSASSRSECINAPGGYAAFEAVNEVNADKEG